MIDHMLTLSPQIHDLDDLDQEQNNLSIPAIFASYDKGQTFSKKIILYL